jgi:hypothetical protein
MFNNIFKIEISANIVAWYGAIIATLSIILAFLNYFRDRTKIKVKISQGFFAYGDHLGREVNVFIEAMNIGRRPVTLTGAGLTLKNGKQMFVIRPELISFPYELQEGKSVQVSLNKNEIFQEAKKENSKISYAWYRVATDKIYKAKFRMKNK